MGVRTRGLGHGISWGSGGVRRETQQRGARPPLRPRVFGYVDDLGLPSVSNLLSFVFKRLDAMDLKAVESPSKQLPKGI